MKLKNVLYAGALMSVALLASCSLNDSDGIQLNGKGVQFSAKINGQQSVTRVSDDSWSDGDKIGIFASTQGTNSEDLATNVQYTTDKDGNLTAVGEPVQYKDATTLTDFKAYYPYSASVANKQVAVNVANQGDQAAIDYLYASVTGKKSNDVSVALPFDHKLVKLVFNMTSTSDLSGLSIKLQGTQPSATLNIADGTVAGTGSAADVTLKTAADGKKSEGIVIPTKDLANVKLVFSKAGKKDQTTAFPSTITSLAGGTKYTIAVKIGETSQGGITVTFGGATISPWTDQKGDIQIPDFEDGGTTPPSSYETVTFPYTEAFGSDLGKFKIEDKTKPNELAAVWSVDTKYSYVKATAYDSSSKTDYATESMLVSPIIDLASANNPVLTFSQIVNYFTSVDVAKTEATVLVKVEGSDWTQATVEGYPSSLGWSWANSSVDLSAYKGKKIQIAFKYVSTADKAGTWEIKSVSVAEKPTTPTEGEKGAISTPYSIAEVMDKQDLTKAWVKAYIVGYVSGQDYDSGVKFAADDNASNTNLLIADAANVKDASKCIPVQLPKSPADIRAKLSLKSVPGNLGKEVWLYGSFEKYFGKPGLKSVVSASFDGKTIIGDAI